MPDSDFTNNVTRMLDARGIDYQIRTYRYDEATHSATEVAFAIGLPVENVYKTLITRPFGRGGKPAAVLIPGPEQLDLRQLARIVDEKKIRLASRSEAESQTGMQAGGISPLGLLQKPFQIFVDARALELNRVYVSAGVRGAQVGLAPSQLLKITNGRAIRLVET